jgi:branched-subunit amino acid aminotransferase/4-amino-4-deoxychorismate lyase
MPVILNGRSVEPDPCILSLALYGYACFTSFTVENGSVKGFKHHLERLGTDAEAIIGIRPREKDIRKNVLKFLHECELRDRIVVRVTVFPADFSLLHPENIKGVEILVTGRPADPLPHKPMRLMTVSAARTLPFQKTTNIIANLKARAIAREKGFDDALMISDDRVTEGATWNVFFQKGGELITPELGLGVLPGVTRRLITDACRVAGTPVVEECISKEKIKEFNCCFATNSATGIVPIKSIDGYEFSEARSMLGRIVSVYAAIPGERI